MKAVTGVLTATPPRRIIRNMSEPCHEDMLQLRDSHTRQHRDWWFEVLMSWRGICFQNSNRFENHAMLAHAGNATDT